MTVASAANIPPFDSRVSTPPPESIVVHAQTKALEVVFSGHSTRLPFEFLRVYSPSAEVQGHGPGQEVLQVGKRNVGINAVEPVGLYAIKPFFSDGHESGIFSWTYLKWLADHHEGLWQDYLARLEHAGASRDPVPGAAPQPPAASCASHGKSAAPSAAGGGSGGGAGGGMPSVKIEKL